MGVCKFYRSFDQYATQKRLEYKFRPVYNDIASLPAKHALFPGVPMI